MYWIKKLLNYLRLNLRHKSFLKKYESIKENQYLSYDENQKKQLFALNKILTHSYNNVPYYREIFEGLDIVKEGKVDLVNLEELSKIPILTKEIIHTQKDKLYSNDFEERLSFINYSGGSTGKPVSFIQDADYAMANKVSTHLAFSWRGFEPYDSMLVLWGAERDTFEGKKPFKSYLKEFYHNKLILNSFKMSSKEMTDYIQVMNTHNPSFVKAYAQSIFELAKFAKENDIFVKQQKAIHLAAGTVYESMRETIEEVFSCKAYNHYGCREVGSIASECSAQSGLHIMIENVVVEVVDEEGNLCKHGEQGEIVVTTLNNFSMPLIRYKIGDIGVFKEYEECPCGCTYPKLEKVLGRTTDIFKTSTGSIVVPEYFIHLIGVVHNRGNIKRFQVIQEELDKVIIKIVKGGDIPEEDLQEIKHKIKLVMGEECEVVFEFVQSISTTATGKFRYTISNLDE